MSYIDEISVSFTYYVLRANLWTEGERWKERSPRRKGVSAYAFFALPTSIRKEMKESMYVCVCVCICLKGKEQKDA